MKPEVRGLSVVTDVCSTCSLLSLPSAFRLRHLQVEVLAQQVPNGKELVDILHYILHEKTSEKHYNNGIRDHGRGSISLKNFVQHRRAQVPSLPTTAAWIR